MLPWQRILAITPVMLATWLAAVADGETISLRGSVSVVIEQLRAAPGAQPEADIDQASASYPETSDQLPLQVAARRSTVEEEAAGAIAAQFSDPRTVPGPNPEEFACNLTLNSLSPEIYYTARASLEETREVLLRASEVGLVLPGQTVSLRGRLFLDGAIAVFAVPEANDLSAVSVTLRVKVVREVGDQTPETLFVGSLHVVGGTGQQVSTTADGDFPTSGIVDTDLAGLDEELSVFRVIVLPSQTVDYLYQAAPGQPFSLRATIELEAANCPGGVGVAAILGTPLDTLDEVIALTRDAAAAKRMMAALRQERAAPTGEPAFWQEPQPLFPACGLLGLESLLALLGLVGLRKR
jgi:hypothetical protein